MSQRVRYEIQAAVCKAIFSLNHQELSDVHASLIQILDLIDQTEALQDSVIKVERDSFQVLMQVG
jgi:hypothetical protein